MLLDDNIGTAWQTCVVQSEAEAECVQPFPDGHLRLRILAADALHHA